MSRKLFVDMDGVLADFDRHYIETVGPLPPREQPYKDVNWEKMAKDEFFAGIPPMPDMEKLWDYAGNLCGGAIVLTGCPTTGREQAEANKRDWIRRHLGAQVEVRCCASKEKSLHCQPGDILVDDWEKYRALWENKGGVWITHTDADSTIRKLFEAGLGL